MKLAIVVQRYGADISGGAELHARQVAEHLAHHADVTILTTGGTGPLYQTQSSVSELDRIVNGGDHRALFEPLDSGVWIRTHVDTVCSLDQQYRP